MKLRSTETLGVSVSSYKHIAKNLNPDNDKRIAELTQRLERLRK